MRGKVGTESDAHHDRHLNMARLDTRPASASTYHRNEVQSDGPEGHEAQDADVNAQNAEGHPKGGDGFGNE